MHESLLLMIGALVAATLLLLAYRSYRQRRNPIRMNIKPGERLDLPDPDESWGSELPNGPARVRARSEPPVQLAAQAVSPPVPTAINKPPVQNEQQIPVLVKRVALANTTAAQRYREESQAEAREAGQSSLLDEPDTDSASLGVETLLVLKVLPAADGAFDGNAILQILLACDLRFGSMGIFHRHEESRGRGPVQFSVASLVEPGSFDLDALPSQTLPGLCFFLALPGPANPIKAFNYMVETAQCILKNLGGELLDEANSAVTLQTLEHGRQRIREFEHQQLMRNA